MSGRGGSGIRQLHLLEALANHFPTDLLTVGAVQDTRARGAAARVIEIPRRRAPWSERPFGRRAIELGIMLGSRFPSAAYPLGPARHDLARQINRVASAYGLICLEHEGLAPLQRSMPGTRWMITLHLLYSGMVAHQLTVERRWRQRQFLRADHLKACALERRLLRRFDQIVVCSSGDAERLAQLATGVVGDRIAVVPNGVDVQSLRATPIPSAPRVLLPGSFDFAPNVDGAIWLCREIWPRVRTAIPDAVLDLVGRSPVQSVTQLDALPGIAIHADVPAMGPYLERARVVAVPIRIGTGTRLKALDAMAAGRPVVGTTVGLDGLGLIDGFEALVADDAEGFAASLVRLLRDDELAHRIGSAGRQRVEDDFGWERIGSDFVGLVTRVLDGSSSLGSLRGAASDSATLP